MELKFDDLTTNQEWLLVLGGWQIGSRYPNGTPQTQPGKRTVKKLIARGLVIPHERTVSSPFGQMTITEYEVPVEVYMAYCMSCDAPDPGAA